MLYHSKNISDIKPTPPKKVVTTCSPVESTPAMKTTAKPCVCPKRTGLHPLSLFISKTHSNKQTNKQTHFLCTVVIVESISVLLPAVFAPSGVKADPETRCEMLIWAPLVGGCGLLLVLLIAVSLICNSECRHQSHTTGSPKPSTTLDPCRALH